MKERLAFATLALIASTTLAAGPPASKIEPVKETVQGVEIVDPYRWLEGDLGDPKNFGKVTPEVGAWTDAQNAYTRSVLDALPGRKELEEKLRPLMEVGTVGAPNARGGRYFYNKREGNQNQPLVYVRDGVRVTHR
jgi:prolyl oligopeptidase